MIVEHRRSPERHQQFNIIGLYGNISTTVGLIAMKFGTNNLQPVVIVQFIDGQDQIPI